MIKIQIPATSANLGAGFDALGLALTYYNYIEMEECDKIDITAADGLDIPTDERNLIYISAKDLFAVCGKKLEGLKLIQTSNIPMARGLGSSSACIIAGLVGANKMLGDPLTKDDLVDLAAQIEGHPDNTAPALLGGIVTAVFDGRKVHWVKQEVFTKLKFVAIKTIVIQNLLQEIASYLQKLMLPIIVLTLFITFYPKNKVKKHPSEL